MASSNEIKARIVGAEADRAAVEQVLAAIGVTAKVGRSWASCPLCGRKRTDKTFKINENGTCQCQKCQRPKNVLDLVMELRGYEFLDAIAFVGEVIGLPLDRNGRPGAVPTKGARPAARDLQPVLAEARRTIPVPIGKPQRSFVAPDGQEIQVFPPSEGMKAELPSRLSSVPVDREALDRGYRILLDHLSLKEQHRRWLGPEGKRGFSDELIDRRLYRSLPKSSNMAAAVDAAVAEMGIEIAVALPGLVVQEVQGKICWMLAARYSKSKANGFPNQGETGDGLVTPVTDAEGLIVALRVRSHVSGENGDWDKKVTWMSSNYIGGATSGAPFHHAVPGQLVNASTILVTEGEDKAQAAAEHHGCRALSLPGLNPAAGEAIVRELELVLSRYGDEIRAVGIALDMDPPSNLNATRDAFITISIVREFCARRGLEFAVGSWDGVKGKGIDDAIRAGAEADWLTGPEIDEHLTLLKGDREIELPRRNAGPAAGPDLLAELDIPVWDGNEDQAGAGELYRYDADGMPIGPVGRAIADPPAPGVAIQPVGEPDGEAEAEPDDFFAHLEAGSGDAPLPELDDLAVKDGQQVRAVAHGRLLSRARMACLPGLPDSAFELVSCPRFVVGPDGVSLYQGEEKAPRPITLDPIIPIAVSRNLETGEEELVIMHWRRGAPGRWVTLRMDARVLASRTHLAALAAHGLEVNIQNAGDLSLYLSEVFRLNSHLLPVTCSTSRMGLQEVDGKWLCLLGDRCVSAAGVTAAGRSDARAGSLSFKPTGAGETALTETFSAKGTIDGQRELMALVADFPKARVIMNAALAASIVTLAGKPGFVLDAFAPNGSSKSTLTRLAASMFGRADDSGGHAGQEVPWSSTLAGLELRAGTLSGLPMFVDDSKHLAGHGGGEKASNVIYTIGGGGKLRAEMGGTGTRSKKVIRTVVVSTGESALTGLLPPNDGGAVTRLLELGHPVPVKSPEMAAVADRIKAGVHRHHGHLGTEWMAFLLSRVEAHDADNRTGAFAELMNDAIDAETMRLARKAPRHPSAARLAGYAAAINVAAGLASMCTVKLLDGSEAGLFPWDQELVDAAEYPEGGAPPAGVPVGRVIDGEIWAGMLEHAADSSGEMKALDSVYAWASANQHHFEGRFDPERDHPKEVFGAWRMDSRDKPWVAIYVLQPKLEEYLRSQGFVPSQVLAAWKEKDLIKSDKGRVTTKSVKVGGEYPRVVAIKREALLAQENGEGQAPQRELALG